MPTASRLNAEIAQSKQVTYTLAMREYFGMRPGTTIKDFLEEMKALNEGERQWFRENLETVGFKVTTVKTA